MPGTYHYPKVSAVVATYNRADFVEGAIQTALNQTYDDIEVIVVDDGSTDGTWEVLRQYEDHDDVHVLYNETNRGISYSRNRGLEHADGEFVAPLDDDDRWTPEKIEKQVQIMQASDDPDLCGVYTDAVIVNEDGTRTGTIEAGQFEPNAYPRILLYCEITPHSSALLRRDHLEAIGGYDERFPRGIDWDLWIRVTKHYRLEHIDEKLTVVHRHGDNISQKSDHERQVRKLVREKYADEFDDHPVIRDNFDVLLYRQHGVYHLTNGNRVQSIRNFAGAVRTKPVLHNVIYLVLAILGPTAFRGAKWAKHNTDVVDRIVGYLRRWEE